MRWTVRRHGRFGWVGYRETVFSVSPDCDAEVVSTDGPDLPVIEICVVYRAFAADRELLYVGVTSQFMQRMHKHRARSPWWRLASSVTAEVFMTRAEGVAAEARAIADERPRFNLEAAQRRSAAGLIAGRKRNILLRTHCRRGHSYDEANTMIRKSKGRTYRVCRSCARELGRLRYARLTLR
jgi:predicted GIY-YIG superfamily endonuclease